MPKTFIIAVQHKRVKDMFGLCNLAVITLSNIRMSRKCRIGQLEAVNHIWEPCRTLPYRCHHNYF